VDQTTIDGCRAKAVAAEERLSLMADEWSAWLAEDAYPSWVVESDADHGRYSVYFDFSSPPPPRFSVIAGEIAHDLRSALDHLAWREAVEWIGPEKAERKAREIAFPLKETAADFKRAKTIGYVGPKARRLMERQQPYKRAKGKGPKSLGLLAWLNNIDKHRTLHAALVTPHPFQKPTSLISFESAARMIEQPTWEIAAGMPVNGETKVACFRFDPAGPDPRVCVTGTPTFVVGFGKLPKKYRGIGINQTIAQVQAIIDEFADLIP
jgi:hypothetical protein